MRLTYFRTVITYEDPHNIEKRLFIFFSGHLQYWNYFRDWLPSLV